jgi:hypothetical protein
LIGFGDKLSTWGQKPREGDLSLVEDILDGLVIGEVKGSEASRRVMCCGGRKRSRLDHWGASKVVVEDGLAVGLEDRFGGHDVMNEEICVREKEKGKRRGIFLS